MNFSLRNFALGAALVASSAMFAQATEPTVIFSEDFEWLAPDWTDWVSADGKSGPAGDAVGTNSEGAIAPQLGSPYIGSISEGTSVTAYQALESKGYNFYAWNASTKAARSPQNQIYLQKSYLKFGLTAYQSGMGIVMPTAAANLAEIEFDFCSQRQGTGKWDPTKLVVIVKNGENEKMFDVPFMAYEDNAPFEWKHVTLPLKGATIEAGTELIIRNSDDQLGSTAALRWYIDNIKVTDRALMASDYDELWSEDFEWMAPWVAWKSLSDEDGPSGDTVGSNDAQTSRALSAAYIGSTNDGTSITAGNALRAKGYNLYNINNTKATLRTADQNIYLQQNYLKFGLTGRYCGIGFVPGKVVENAYLTFDWCTHRETSAKNQYKIGEFDPTEIVVIVKNGNDEKQFAVPVLDYAKDADYAWKHVEIALEGVKIGKNTEIIIRNADSQWPLTDLWTDGSSAYPRRWYLDNVKLYGEEMPFTGELSSDWKAFYNPTGHGYIRSGMATQGKFYFTDQANLYMVDGTKDAEGKDVITTLAAKPADATFNVGLTADEAGNVLVSGTWAGSDHTKWYLLRNGATEFEPITIVIDGWTDARSDQFGRAIGDFTSEEGGFFFITANGNTKPYPVHIANGEFVGPYLPGDVNVTAPNGQEFAIPAIEKVTDIDNEDDFGNAFYFSTRAHNGGISYVGEDAEGKKVLKTLTQIPADKFPEGWRYIAEYGFDAINLAGEIYKAQRVGIANWDKNFAISDNKGNVIYMSNYDPNECPAVNGDGGQIVMRKTSYNTADVFVTASWHGTVGSDGSLTPGNGPKTFVEKFTLEVPVPAIYIAGAFQGWAPADPAEFTYEGNGLYTFEFDQPGGGFKISTVKGDWDVFNTGLLGTDPHTIAVGETYDLIAGFDGDYQLAKGHYILTLDMDAMTISVDGEATVEIPELYLRGEFNGWGASDESKFTAPEEFNADGYAIFTLEMAELEGKVKIATAPEWTINMGGVDIPSAGTYTLALEGADMMVTKMKNVKMTLAYPKNITDAITLAVECDQFVARKAFAYDLNATNDNGAYTITYKLSAPAKAVELVLTDAAGNQTTQALTGVAAGENTAAIDAPAEGEYTWALNVTSESEADKLAYAFKADKALTDKIDSYSRYATGGVVWMDDPEYDAYGMTVIGNGLAQGYMIYDATGAAVTAEPIFVGFEKLTPTNGSSTTRGAALRGKAVFADWSDEASGAWVIDPMNTTAEPWNMIMPEGAEMAVSGAVTYNGVQTASGTPTVAFQGKGEDTKMFMFDEDIYGNVLVRYDLGTADYVMAAPTLVMSGYKGKMGNTNIEVEPIEDGFFVSQVRADKDDATCPALMYFDNEGALLWDASNKGLEQKDVTSGIAVNAARNLIAISAYEGIYVYDLAFNDFDEPEIGTLEGEVRKAKYSIAMPIERGARTNSWMQLCFDAADNLHIYSRDHNGYSVLVLPGETTANTPAKAANTIVVASGVENIAIDANAAVEYFNLNGIAVDADNLTPGIYIRRQGNVATKVIVK